jgi:hypothetical protein
VPGVPKPQRFNGRSPWETRPAVRRRWGLALGGAQQPRGVSHDPGFHALDQMEANQLPLGPALLVERKSAAAGLVGTVEMTPRAQAKGSRAAKERGGVQGHHCRPGSRFLG